MQRVAEQPAAGGEAIEPPTGGGQSLPGPVQDKMEHAFGADFSDVRIHTDSPQAQQLGALAFTHGRQVAFAPGHYDPDSQGGQELLGHELTHVVQQASGRVADPAADQSPINDDPGLEQDADVLGTRAARGETVAVPGAAPDETAQAKRGPAATQAKRGPIQAQKSRKKSAAKAVGRGLINVVLPVFTWKDFFENIEAGWSKEENPLLGKSAAKNAGIKALITLKELGQLTAGLATMAATIFGIAAIFFPYLSPVAALCGLIATIAHAVTLVLRGVHTAIIGGALHSLANARSPEAIAAKKKLEAAKWAEIGGMIGNAIGVIFGGFGGAFGASPASMTSDAAAGFAGQAVSSTAQAGTIGAATSSMSAGGANAMGALFGQAGNSAADAFGGASARHGKISAEQIAPPAAGGPVPIPYPNRDGHEDESSSEDPSSVSAEDIAEAQSVATDVLVLNQAAQHPTVAPPDPNEVSQLGGDLDALAGQVQGAAGPVAQIEAADPSGDGVPVSDTALQSADAGLSAQGEEQEGGGGAEADSEEDQAPPARPQAGAPAAAPPRPPPPRIVITPAEDEAPARSEEREPAPNLLQVPQSNPGPSRAAMPPVQTKQAPGSRRPVQAKLGSWFKRKVVNRVKRAYRKAKAKLMAKIYQLLGLDKKAAEAKQQVAQLSAASGDARAAESSKKAAAAAAAARAEELKNRAKSK